MKAGALIGGGLLLVGALLLAGGGATLGPRFSQWPLPVSRVRRVGDSLGAPRAHGPHQGLDLFADAGTPVIAPEVLDVVQVRDGSQSAREASRRAGQFVVLMGPGGRRVILSHLATGKVLVSPGDRITPGTPIGEVAPAGSSGVARDTPPHLHVEVREGGTTINPLSLLPPSGRADLDRRLVA